MLLTVEEAGEVLRIGRTKAYAMAREWRETEGQSGLPVIDLGHVLRVPRRALEELLGSELSDVPNLYPRDNDSRAEASSEPPPIPVNVSTEIPPADQSQAPLRNRRRRETMADQLDLFDTEQTAS
ncbi:MAG: helix-turn-helix domain-containing protein [Acidimicrobiia bacterium]|nr:helix-turn-helix domain-containing protein [Acidimicrobiia bacterium]